MAQKTKKTNRYRDTLLKRLVQRAQANDIKPWTAQSQSWFRDKVKLFGGKSTFDNIERDGLNTGKALERGPGIGFMYTFAYFAKHDKKLPYWDRYPLIFVIKQYDDGFLGINLHYLSPRYRAVLMDRLLDLASDTRYTNKTKLLISYEILNAASQLSLFKPCVKRYLYSQLQSKVIKISSDEWEPAIYLNTQRFVRASNSKVWSDSIKKAK